MTNIISRAKAILLDPKSEWQVISLEKTTLTEVFTKYVIPLALLPAVAGLLGSLIFRGYFSPTYYIFSAVLTYAAQLISFIITTFVVDLLAPTFDGEKDKDRSAQLVGYASTAAFVGGALNVIPFLGVLGSLAGGIYSLYLLYMGIIPMKKVPEDKRLMYVIISIIVLFAANLIIMGIFTATILTGLLGTSMSRGFFG